MYTIYFIDNISKIEAWRFTVNDIELLAGIIAGSVGILEDYNSFINNKNNSPTKQYYLDTDLDISDFRIEKYITESEIKNKKVNIKSENYAIWLRSEFKFHYNLYKFKTINFLNGILKICEMLNVDNKTYIYGCPFDYLGNKFFEVIIKEIAISVPDRQYEIKEEERGNENVIELLRKDY